MNYQKLLDEITEEVRPYIGTGKVADYIPALARVNPGHFGLALATVDGELFGSGDWQTPFSAQSVTKVFTLALVLAAEGDVLWKRVGREPSGNPFNSLVQLEYERGIPRNPFINAGALVVTDRLLSLTGEAFGSLREFLRAEGGSATIDAGAEVASSEREHGDRNAALAHFPGELPEPREPELNLVAARRRSTAARTQPLPGLRPASGTRPPNQINPRFCCAKRPMFGNATGRSVGLTPNQLARVAAY